VTGIGFLFIVLYIIGMYFLISPATNKELLYLPLFFRGAGNVVIYVVLTVYAARTIPFMPFFQALTVLGFARTCLGTPLGTAILGRAFSVLMKSNIMSLSTEIDLQNPIANTISFTAVMSELQRQAMLVTIKEIFGYAAIAGVFILILTLCTRYKNLIKLKMPRWE
jgi:MFS transporter, DHA2 family, multidrug resistance protein